jgi:hypothetical protein
VTEAKSGGYAYNPQASRDEAQRILRELYQANAVKDPTADRLLVAYAMGQGWRRNP